MSQNGAGSIGIPIFCLTTLINSEEAFSYEERHNIDKNLFSEVSSSNSLRSPVDRCFRKTIAFSDFKFDDKFYNVWKHFYEEFAWDVCI